MLLRATGEGMEEGEKELASFFSEGKLLHSVVGFGSEALDLCLGIEACTSLIVECAYLIDVGSAPPAQPKGHSRDSPRQASIRHSRLGRLATGRRHASMGAGSVTNFPTSPLLSKGYTKTGEAPHSARLPPAGK